MRAVVREAFLGFTVPLEGEVLWFYPDAKGLVSIGIGNLVDDTKTTTPPESALSLPMVRPDGQAASRGEIAADWTLAKLYPNGARLGHLALEHVCKLRLTPAGLEQLVFGRLDLNDSILRKAFPEFEDWPADAQLGAHSMAWAVGPAFQRSWPKFTAALRERDFHTAAAECFMPEERTITGLRPRNRANRVLFTNAALSPDPDVLYWPRALADELPTQPDLENPDSEPTRIVHPLVDFGKVDLGGSDDGDGEG